MARYSQLEISKHKGQVLDRIMAWKREEVARQMGDVPLAQLKALALVAEPPLDFAAALTAEAGASLIAEVKRASPSKGLIAQDWSPTAIAETYARGGAAAISCLTDARFFQGKLAYLAEIVEHLRASNLSTPLLRKEFIYHPYQVYEARAAGADALLLIVGVLGDADLRELLCLTNQLGMSALVEVHNEEELERALAAEARIIGVNNRNLKTFDVDIETTGRLRKLIPADIILIGESGIRNAVDVRRMAEMGCDAILVGESFCKLPQAKRGALVREFALAGKP
ncbi:MAG: indole-3-glycerol phosphate synthase TrpC [Caldilineaceae bacterium]|nr:indole-3-glycerol phosphate synthase TrpC [Caldilineaceae bacterium]